MVTVSGKYTLLHEATSRMNAVKADYEIWLDYQKSKGIAMVRELCYDTKKNAIVYVVLTRKIEVYAWCKIASSLKAQGYSPILLNAQELI